MLILIYFFIFLFGLAVGSFLNSVIYRLERGESFFFARSYCPACQHILTWKDLIPVFSFIFLKGKCRYCQQKISWQYPLVELATAFIFSLIFFQNYITLYSSIWKVAFYWIFSSFLIVIFVYDLKHYIIPDRVIYPALGITFLYQIISNFQFPISITSFQFLLTNLYLPFLSALGAAIFFLIIILISHGQWLGIGDLKLAFLMGLFLSFPNILVALFSAFFLGAIIGIGLIIARKKTMKSPLPFGPFLVTGTFTAFFWTEKIINWYFHLFRL